MRPGWPALSVSTGLGTEPLEAVGALVACTFGEHRTWSVHPSLSVKPRWPALRVSTGLDVHPHVQRSPKGWGRHVAHPDTDGPMKPWDMVTAPESLNETQMACTTREHRT